MAASSFPNILGQKLYEGKTKAIYSIIDQPSLICIHRKDFYDSTNSILSAPTTRRGSIDSAFRFNLQSRSRSNTETELNSKSILTTSITTCVYEILREASIPTFFVAVHPQPDMFIAKKCTKIPIRWIIRRLANETYVKRNPAVAIGYRFVPVVIELYYKRQSMVSRRGTLTNTDDILESDRDSPLDEGDSDSEEHISSICSYEQLLNTHIHLENMKISPTDLEYMYEICSTVFDILEHVWMVEKNCQLIDLKIEFGITTTTNKEIVVANIYDSDTWHITRPMEKISLSIGNLSQENLIWINNALRDILDLNAHLQSKMGPILHNSNNEEEKSNVIPEEGIVSGVERIVTLMEPSTVNRCIVVCSSLSDVEYAQQIKTILIEFYNIQCDIRLFSIYKSSQTLSKLLSQYSYEHRRPTVFITLGNINNGLATCLSSNCSHPLIHCLNTNSESTNTLHDIQSFTSNDTALFTVVFTLSSAIHNVIKILAMNDWRLWTKQRGRRFKKYMDLILADQQLIKTQAVKTNNAILMNMGAHFNTK